LDGAAIGIAGVDGCGRADRVGCVGGLHHGGRASPDAKELSTFYAKLLGKPVTYEGEGVAMIGEDGAQPVMFQQITEYHAPRWPDPAYPQQFHLDVTVDDVDAAEAEVLKLGATSLSSGGVNWRVYADPAGKPFCLCWD
jgi:Glyoxalase-like domain